MEARKRGAARSEEESAKKTPEKTPKVKPEVSAAQRSILAYFSAKGVKEEVTGSKKRELTK